MPLVRPAQSAYLIFCSTVGKEIRTRHGNLSRAEHAQMMAAAWNGLTPQQLSRFEKLAEMDKERYRKESAADAQQASVQDLPPPLNLVEKVFGSVREQHAWRQQAHTDGEATAALEVGADLTYGEFDLVFLGALLELAAPRAGEVFVDIGSGCGRLTCAAALLYPSVWHCAVGIELVEALHEDALQKHAALLRQLSSENIAPCEFLCDSVEHALPLLLSSAPSSCVVFCYATLWKSDGLHLTELSELLGTSMSDGSRVIVAEKLLVSDAETPPRWTFEEVGSRRMPNRDTGMSSARLYVLRRRTKRQTPPPAPSPVQGVPVAIAPPEEPPDGAGLMALCHLPEGRSQWSWTPAPETEVRPVAGAGLGVCALRSYSPGERILCELPLVRWTSTPNAAGAHDPRTLEDALRKLSSEQKRAFYSLAQSADVYSAHAAWNGEAVHPSYSSVWERNAYPTPAGDGVTPVDDGTTRSAVFAHICRINHACHPSCHVSWNDAIGRMTVHALRKISPGEELTVAYIGGDTLGTRSSRQEILQSRYGFVCRCETCELQGKSLQASEARQQRLAAIHAELRLWPPKLVDLVDELLRLHVEDGMPLIWAKSPIFLALLACRKAKDFKAAAAWARRGATCARIALGSDSGVFKKFDALVSTLGQMKK